MATLTVKSDLSELNKVRYFLEENLKRLNLSEDDFYKIELSVVEMYTNIIRFAYPQGKGEIALKTWHKEGRIFLEIRDSGIPFDPTKEKTPDLEEILNQGKKGGFGIFLSRKFMDSFSYRRENNQNVLTMSKKYKAA
jgi:anti-sigma regulatory factor (Ser/Thr protein kinase)